jgi:hypothetical protein
LAGSPGICGSVAAGLPTQSRQQHSNARFLGTRSQARRSDDLLQQIPTLEKLNFGVQVCLGHVLSQDLCVLIGADDLVEAFFLDENLDVSVVPRRHQPRSNDASEKDCEEARGDKPGMAEAYRRTVA